MPTYLLALDDALLVHVLRFAAERDVEATTVASKLVAMHLLPQYPEIWRVLFARHWGKLNFQLDAMAEDAENLVVDTRLRALFPLIISQEKNKSNGQRDDGAVTKFAFDGARFGYDRSVRANAPFPTSLYIAVFNRRVQDPVSKKKSSVYQIGATTSSYFEISISDPVSRPSSHTLRNGRVEMTAIGLVPSSFPLVGKQPGWTIPSFGYHGDNGKIYSAFPWKPFAPRFGVNDTVGCGIRHSSQDNGRRVFFTHNGSTVTSRYLPGSGRYIPCDNAHEWFPAVGLDSPNTIHVNFGQHPFMYDHVIDELFSECMGMNALAARQMLQNSNKARSRSVRRNCIDAFIANVLERHNLTTTMLFIGIFKFAAGMTTSLSGLGDELLAHVLSFAAPRDVESLTVASSVVARDVVPQFPIIWKNIFRRRWEALNYPLDSNALLQINENLDALFPSSCTESRKFQLLAHAIIPVPSYADIRETQKALGYTDAYHRIVSLQAPELRESHSVDFALDGGMLGDDRCVRANMPFPTTFHVAVYKRNPTEEDTAQGHTQPVYQVGVVPGGYFELSLSKRQHRHARVPSMSGQEVMTSIGLVNAKFPLVGKQPGWTRRSHGYHGDDGRYYHGTPFEVGGTAGSNLMCRDANLCFKIWQFLKQGRPFGPMFKSGSTVGCGVRINPRTGTIFAFFTNNGELISGEDGAYVECEHRNWYPAVGLDSYDALHLNFGQEPFVYSAIADELFEECNDMATTVSEQLQWYDISDSDGESSEDEENDDNNDSGDSFGSNVSDEEVSARLIMRILAMRRAGTDVA
ncbi:Ran-binding protein 9 [Phytophthora nicotianae]|uniref:Ran-binding protein 9 n=1 Tax=Phytophthora nicotianae TaxID=4792 RepID=A0A0W8CR93_PHYNI|nr:Ran-binding protein 9 [Phytophthora nicotianae]